MKKTRLLALAMAFVCALGMAGLVACSGGSSSSAASDSGSSAASAASESAAPEPTDEEVIKADAQAFLDTLISKELITAALQEDETFQSFAEMGLDMDDFATKLAGVIKLSVGDVTVNGDTANAAVTLTMPDFSADTDALVEEAMSKATEGDVDLESMSESEQVTFIMDIMLDVLSSPDMPTTSMDFDLKYAKDNGTWKVDEDSVDMESLGDLAKMFS